MNRIVAPAFIRGEVVRGALVEFGGRGAERSFLGPDPLSIVDRLPLDSPSRLHELYTLRFEDTIQYLVELGKHLDVRKNEYLQESLENSYEMTDMTPPLLRRQYAEMPLMFSPEAIREAAELSVGIRFLDGWVNQPTLDGRRIMVRAIGARTLHIVPGNSPLASALTILRNAIARSDAIIKAPSNDPLTALAIARTMLRMAPDHPITRHVVIAYWKGGSEACEARLFRPENIDKIIAWGGFASVKHVTRYIQPGLELVCFDPKRSASIIGPEAFATEQSLRDVALRAATDIGAFNQLGCVSARVLYVVSGTDRSGLDRINRLGAMIYEALRKLPGTLSTPALRLDPELRSNIDALRASTDFYNVIGGRKGEGAIIVSQLDERVDFYPSLAGRVANLVPLDDVSDAIKGVNAYTQTIGIYPDSLKERLRDLLPFHGAQRLVSLGYAASLNTAVPQDAFEPMRRMVKWIVDDTCDPRVIKPLWEEPSPEVVTFATTANQQ